jgi:hypothetical protein
MATDDAETLSIDNKLNRKYYVLFNYSFAVCLLSVISDNERKDCCT